MMPYPGFGANSGMFVVTCSYRESHRVDCLGKMLTYKSVTTELMIRIRGGILAGEVERLTKTAPDIIIGQSYATTDQLAIL